MCHSIFLSFLSRLFVSQSVGARAFFFTHFGCNEIRDNAFITFQIDVAHMDAYVWYVWTMNRFGNVPLLKTYCEIESFTIIIISSASFSPSRSPLFQHLHMHTFEQLFVPWILSILHSIITQSYAYSIAFDCRCGFYGLIYMEHWFKTSLSTLSHTGVKNTVRKKINNDNKEEAGEGGEKMIQQQIPLKTNVCEHYA